MIKSLPLNSRGAGHLVALVFVALIGVAGCYLLVKSHAEQANRNRGGLTNVERKALLNTAQRTWNFYQADVDPGTHLPRNSIIPTKTRKDGNYTSGTDIGFYINSIVAACDLGLINSQQAIQQLSALLATLKKLQTSSGFLLRWYDTGSGKAITGPSGVPLAGTGDEGTNTAVDSSAVASSDVGFISTVDDAWYAQALVVARQAFPSLAPQISPLLSAMNWSKLYDAATNQLYIGYNVGKEPTPGTYAELYGGTRMALYVAIGSRTVPGGVWWGVSRTPSVKAQRQVPQGSASPYPYVDPQSGKTYRVVEDHYVYSGIQFVPTWAGSMFQALAPNLVVPEISWGPNNLGVNDSNTIAAQAQYATNDLGYSVWGFAPSTTPDRLTGYAQYGAPALAVKKGTIPDDGITPYASFLALPIAPRQAYTNIQTLAKDYPGLTAGPYGYYDTVDPTSGQVAERYMDVSQGVVLAGIDNTLNSGKLQSYFANDAYGQSLRPYLALDNFHLQPVH